VNQLRLPREREGALLDLTRREAEAARWPSYTMP
jgi:hypothetical protein